MAEQVNAPITISMALDMRRNRIRIHKPTIHLLFDPEDMVVAIVCRDTEVSGGQEVRINPRGLKSRNCFEFCSSMFLRKLREVHGGLDANASYRLTGKIIPELRAASFPMSTIQKIENDEGASVDG